MSDTNETIADIIADMRGLVKPGDTLNHTYELLNGLADRLEAAWKREKAAIEADALAVGGLVEASRSTAENSSAVGAAAKLREAAEKVVEIAEREWMPFVRLPRCGRCMRYARTPSPRLGRTARGSRHGMRQKTHTGVSKAIRAIGASSARGSSRRKEA